MLAQAPKREGTIQCPKCGKDIVPAVTKHGCIGQTRQRVCPLCGKRIGFSQGVACCFIATAAFGSALDDRVRILCKLRDEYLLSNTMGRSLVKSYYSVSPPIAERISSSEVQRTLVRFLLYPIVLVLTVLVGDQW